MKIILASASPRRRELLQQIGLTAEIIPPEIDEERRAGEETPVFLERVATAKALQVYSRKRHQDLIVAADTIVAVDDHVLGKPVDRADARRMLELLSGRRHEVWTGIALLHKGATHFDCAVTAVDFKRLESDEIERYLDWGEYADKAGAYGIQGRAALFVERISGCFFNVVGFPVNLFYEFTRRLGLDIYDAT